MAKVKRNRDLENLGLTFLDRWTKACRAMILHYRIKKELDSSSCVFCAISGDYQSFLASMDKPIKEACFYCMWTLISGKETAEAGNAHCYMSFWAKLYKRGLIELRLQRPLVWRLASIWRIKRWLRQLENAYTVLLIKEHYETHTREENP